MKKEYDFSKGRRGAVVVPSPGKTRITIRLDDDVLEWFRNMVNEAGAETQTLINDALREYVGPKFAKSQKHIMEYLFVFIVFLRFLWWYYPAHYRTLIGKTYKLINIFKRGINERTTP